VPRVGRFAVFGGYTGWLCVRGDRRGVIVAGGGVGSIITAEVYEEALGRWRRLPCTRPNVLNQPWSMESALMAQVEFD
jgi:hypothetical protein